MLIVLLKNVTCVLLNVVYFISHRLYALKFYLQLKLLSKCYE